MIKTLITSHIVLGTIALFAGFVALLATKGNKTHRLAGKIFFYTMLASALVAIYIALMPNHENSFLLAIGIFTNYFLLSGYAALKYRNRSANILEQSISWIMLLTGILMIALPIYFNKSINIIITVFGILSIFLAIRDIFLFRKPEQLKEKWLTLHLTKMVSGYISAFSAFLVANNVFPIVYLNWFLPGIIGGFYIAYWIGKVEKSS